MITKDNNLKVMELFFKYPYRDFHIRELARLTKLSSTGIIKIIGRLKHEKLLTSKKFKNLEQIRPNFDGRFFLIKRLYNIYSLYDSGLVETIKSYYEMPNAIILFGSYSSGTDSEKSDIDLVVISNKKEMPDLKKFETKLTRKINLHIIDMKNTPKEFINSLANGIILDGFAEMIK
jgi:predicted nucleotidyltransferase